MTHLIRSALQCLSRCHERDLCFILGRRLTEFPHMAEGRIREKSRLARYRKLTRILKGRMQWRTQPAEPTEFLVYAGSENEFMPLAPLARILARRGRRVCILCSSSRVARGDRSAPDVMLERYGFRTLLAALFLLARRGPMLARELRQSNDTLLARLFVPNLCRVYVYLPYFLEVLGKTRPRYVLVANDHNPNTRSLLAAARHLGVRTVYMQHAAVTRLFPPLDVELAFLDGIESARAYSEAASESNSTGSTRVFLSGQKKPLQAEHEHPRTAVGVAVNHMDGLDDVVNLVERLVAIGVCVLVRTHPNQRQSFRRRLEAALADEPLAEVSDPASEPVGDFLARCRLLLAGHSSIHLEAAIAGVNSCFIALSSSPISDFYGFLRGGLIEPLPEEFWQQGATGVERLQQPAPARLQAVRRFSATYGTPWQGRESELVAKTLEQIERGDGLESIYEPLAACPGFRELWTLRT